MIELTTARAHPSLQAVVSGFTQRRAFMPELEMIRPLAPRPDQFLEFYFREPYRVRIGDAPFAATSASVLVGVTATPGKELAYQGEIETFAIQFRPTGLARLFGLPMNETVDEGLPLLDALKAETARLDARLRVLKTFPERVACAQAWLTDALEHARPHDAIDHAASLLARTQGQVGIAEIADRAGLSARQVQRRFLADVGVAPKAFARICRFDAAVQARKAAPHVSWASIAARMGYVDQAHLAKEFRALGGRAPAELSAAMMRVRESMSEIYKPDAPLPA